MAVGKNKRLTKGGKKGAKKKIVDPFSKKEWYDVKAPSMFAVRQIGKTLVTRSQGTKIASTNLKGRVFEVSLADLQNDEVTFRKFKLIAEEVQGRNLLTNFHGMSLTRDKLCSMVKKWQIAQLVVASLRGQEVAGSKHSRAQSGPLLVGSVIPDSIGKDIEKTCQGIYPLHDVLIHKVKVLKKPKFDVGKLMELHGEGTTSTTTKSKPSEGGEKVDGYEPPVLDTV
ncbi:40S ribosomal protein S3a [Elysia marginata]|uniref:Small ribosomal subunit protein eS1 n=1 Tax=Elysia marginata TaxID=1093978 RepID=A0AAV4JTD0_9GAST|nr:40S ribosomal protein S3a [Elysia marginata]